ncbi:probable Rho GTPase-activating protein CG5521 isoform X3 [Anthonomus grandis grandis]|uniref:probable Rho GTPase-activating protein CG5521 isoform X3 n=1 Tax=Anthonomus grandis grandis TaxID=2921223 RepID=UPI0021668FA6|nr:probable Rho GTPase-activating protein CG5521 isoform X3 [Anthonomus grandis grandis]
MFSKKNLVDVKKSTAKIQDPKKDLANRIKHLKLILDNVDTAEAKGLFEANFSHIYNILYESFLQMESNLRQRVHKAHKEELDCTLWILEQVICLLPELIHRRWQLHSLGRMLTKLLHTGNSMRLRRQGIKYFLMWYQALNENAPDYVHKLFASLVPGFNNQGDVVTSQGSASVFHDPQNPVSAPEMLPILPPSSGEKLPDHPSRFYLEALLDHMVHTVVKLEWQDKSSHHHRCFSFLFEQFKIYYLPKICSSFNYDTSLYRPNLELPLLRKMENETEFVFCRVSLIMWVTNYIHQGKRDHHHHQQQQLPNQRHGDPPGHGNVQGSVSMPGNEDDIESAHHSLDSTISNQTNKTATDEEVAHQIVRDVLCSTRENVDFIHEIYRQAFLLNFSHVVAIRKIILVYKDIIQGNVTELPLFALEPPDEISRHEMADNGRAGRLRNDSYLGAIHKENVLVRAGIQNLYQLFMTHAANVFLLEVNPHIPRLLEEQTDACKRILNIYRYMVMNVRMDSNTWEQLLLVLLQITSLVLGETPPKKKALTLGGKLAPAIFQTLIVTWIKANLNVSISRELWDRFLDVLTSLTNWEELIKEWAKTMETLTRVLARHVYNLDLMNLPLDRLNDHKNKRTRRLTVRTDTASSSVSGGNPSDGLHQSASRQDSSLPDGNIFTSKRLKSGLSRSYSEASLNIKMRSAARRSYNNKHRRSKSLELLPPADTESTDRTRSPSPAPSSGIESSSIKDSPIQLDVLVENHNGEQSDEQRGVVCGGTVRGWIPDVAVILWKRMLGALGDINQISDPKLHCQVFEYLIKLTDTLIRIKNNQGVSLDNLSTPQAPELIPPVTLVLPWCFGALTLPDSYESGKLNALRLLISIMLNCDPKYRTCLSQFYAAIHSALTGPSRATKHTAIKYLGPRFLSLQLPGSTLLLLDIVQACNDVLHTTPEKVDSAPRTEAVSILANLLSLPDDLRTISVFQPEQNIGIMSNCQDIKEQVVSILLRAGKREPSGKARCIALSRLGMFVYKELSNQTFHPKIVEAVTVLLMALKFSNKMIAQLASDILFLLCSHAAVLWTRYPRLGNAVISELCAALLVHAPLGATASESDRALCTSLLLCLGEWCMKLGTERLLQPNEYGEHRSSCLLLQVFSVLHKIITGSPHQSTQKTMMHPEDFDPTIVADDPPHHARISEGSIPSSFISNKTQSKSTHYQRAVALCAETVLAHLVNHLGHFPLAIGAARLSSLVSEHDDIPCLSSDDLSNVIFSVPNIQLFILSKNVIASLIELPTLVSPGGGATAGLVTADKQVRVLLRDISGKSSWDASILYRTPESVEEEAKTDLIVDYDLSDTGSCMEPESLMPEGLIPQNLPQRAMRHRPPNVLPDVSNAAPDLDQLDDLLQYLGHTSPECLECPNIKLNEPGAPPLYLELEQEVIASVISQKNVEIEESRITQHSCFMMGKPVRRPMRRQRRRRSSISSIDSTLNTDSFGNLEQNAFQQCRLLFSQLGLSGWDRRKQVHLLEKNDRLLRELRNLDNQSCRETHKFAVIYVAPGQEDKNSILSNQSGSAAYEQFLASLAWEIELEYHTGFLGGLQKQGSTGLTAPYVASSFMEAIFHVATRMPGESPEAVLNKTRHLGNDEVHIVWSEHNRDYRRDIIPTEFCDILIVIYPLGNNLNRVTVDCKADVPYFGVLFNEAIVESNILAGLVRATAICASRAKRMTYQYYQQYYEERARSLETVVSKHKSSATFEEFISKVYSPVPSPSPFCPSGASSLTCTDSVSCANNSSTLAAALIDSAHGHSHKSGQRVDQKFRASANEPSRTISWLNPSETSSGESSISPRALKKLGNLKNARKSLKQEQAESPPESPVQMTKRK